MNFSLFKKIVTTPGVSGFENEIRPVISKELSASCDNIYSDTIGNLIVRKGSGEKKVSCIRMGDLVTGKSLDNRISVYALIEIIKKMTG